MPSFDDPRNPFFPFLGKKKAPPSRPPASDQQLPPPSLPPPPPPATSPSPASSPSNSQSSTSSPTKPAVQASPVPPSVDKKTLQNQSTSEDKAASQEATSSNPSSPTVTAKLNAIAERYAKQRAQARSDTSATIPTTRTEMQRGPHSEITLSAAAIEERNRRRSQDPVVQYFNNIRDPYHDRILIPESVMLVLFIDCYITVFKPSPSRDPKPSKEDFCETKADVRAALEDFMTVNNLTVGNKTRMGQFINNSSVLIADELNLRGHSIDPKYRPSRFQDGRKPRIHGIKFKPSNFPDPAFSGGQPNPPSGILSQAMQTELSALSTPLIVKLEPFDSNQYPDSFDS